MPKNPFQKHHSDKLSKVDYWKKWELFELFDDLHAAEKLLTDITTGKEESEFAQFKNEFLEELYEIKGDNVADFTRIWEWFAPTKEWDTLVGERGKQLGDNIFRITDKWKKNQT
jgi:hypothetical protein